MMTDELKQKRDELAADHSMTFGGDNGINGAGEPPQYDQSMYESFKEGFNAAYKLMEAENAELKKKLSITNSNWPHEKKLHETVAVLKSSIKQLEAENADLRKDLETIRNYESSEMGKCHYIIKDMYKENEALKSRIERLEAMLTTSGKILMHKFDCGWKSKNHECDCGFNEVNKFIKNLKAAALKADEGEG